MPKEMKQEMKPFKIVRDHRIEKLSDEGGWWVEDTIGGGWHGPNGGMIKTMAETMAKFMNFAYRRGHSDTMEGFNKIIIKNMPKG